MNEKRILTRERRTEAITAFQGTNKKMQEIFQENDEIQQRIRTFSQDKKSELYEALHLLQSLKHIVVIVHGTLGDAAVFSAFSEQENDVIWYSTALNERDSILGSDEKLRETILHAYEKESPEAIFIVGTSVVAINNDDVESVSRSLQREIPIPILLLYTDGFKTKAEINGIDIVLHELLKNIKIKEKIEMTGLNILCVSQTSRNIEAIKQLVGITGITSRILIRGNSFQDIMQNAIDAEASLAIDEDESNVFIEGLRQKTKQKILSARTPIGNEGTAAWLRAIGKGFHQETKIEEYIEKQEVFWEKQRQTQPFAGMSVFIAAKSREAIEIALFLQSLGAEICGISVPFIDRLNYAIFQLLPEDIFIHVGEGQLFEIANILTKSKPDVYIGAAGLSAWVAELDIVPISTENLLLYGYTGAKELIYRVSAAYRNRAFVRQLQKGKAVRYKQSWLKKNADWYVKAEVK